MPGSDGGCLDKQSTEQKMGCRNRSVWGLVLSHHLRCSICNCRCCDLKASPGRGRIPVALWISKGASPVPGCGRDGHDTTIVFSFCLLHLASGCPYDLMRPVNARLRSVSTGNQPCFRSGLRVTWTSVVISMLILCSPATLSKPSSPLSV